MNITVREVLEGAREFYPDKVMCGYAPPMLYVFVVSDEFQSMPEEDRIREFSQKTGLSVNGLSKVEATATIRLCLCTHGEYLEDYAFVEMDPRKFLHWLPFFDPNVWHREESNAELESAGARVIHFYGYKGGQARSTVLATISKALSDDGYRVLIVDADIEAPSLDGFFSVYTDKPEQTLMGLSGWADEFRPLPSIYASKGAIDLVPCRPRDPLYDMDFAAFVSRSSIDPEMLAAAVAKLRSGEDMPIYDVILIDHRTGLSSSVIPVMSSLPGSSVIFARPDSMVSRGFEAFLLETLFSFDVSFPGLFVSFSLDPKDAKEGYRKDERSAKFIESSLASLGKVLGRGESGGDVDPAELDDYWITWFHDQAFLRSEAPNLSQVSPDNVRSIGRMRALLGLSEQATRPTLSAEPVLSRSGAVDEGFFILTSDFARLFQRDSPYLYIFGRKGTGKTRLVKELSARDVGEPLLVSSDYEGGGVRSNSTEFELIMDGAGSDYFKFWWGLLFAALSVRTTVDEGLVSLVRERQADIQYDQVSVEKLAKSSSGGRVFLIDGVETAVPASRLREFVESLFRFLSAIQYDRAMRGNVTVRLLLRSDLSQAASQNIEQQIEGKSVELRWDRKSILNFALARIISLDFFVKQFPEACGVIEEMKASILRGEVSEERCEEVLLMIFPQTLQRNKIRTTTFFATYFSDSAGDDPEKAGFYPRLFDEFLRELARKSAGDAALANGRLASAFILSSYDTASSAFIREVRQELETLLEFSESAEKNKEMVGKFISSFEGMSTPFSADSTIQELAVKTAFTVIEVQKAIDAMKRLGIFEDRPGYPGHWRVGRVYKSGLRMLYGRTKTPAKSATK
ncbi:MinD/ParA family ATP-binding protein [Xanthomonas euvesicatoria]|uniref:MinD/ParA family ATP-binding protein n=1 Tax=Xanthomonas euvesicatoria TaxID=456327 RepID=UPI001C43C649|nr:AAA family ATPase [Xanthomonas euvesicatoria]MBV6797713.1 hypothetical protein [Xanthomonas campestris pv. obscurae]